MPSQSLHADQMLCLNSLVTWCRAAVATLHLANSRGSARTAALGVYLTYIVLEAKSASTNVYQPCSVCQVQEHARDSFENLLLSLCRFYELTGHYPNEVLVISYAFKHERFADLHRAALLWPDHRFRFLGTPALMPGAEEVGIVACQYHNCACSVAARKLEPTCRHVVAFDLLGYLDPVQCLLVTHLHGASHLCQTEQMIKNKSYQMVHTASVCMCLSSELCLPTIQR